MMGRKISDPYNSEGGGSIEGMGLLECETVFAEEKHQTRVSGKFSEAGGFFGCLSGADFYGYEIHMGETSDSGSSLTDRGGSFSGDAAGCYIHGIFDSADVSGRIVRKLFEKKGLEYNGGSISREKYLDGQFDLLADSIRKSIDMNKIYRIIKEGI